MSGRNTHPLNDVFHLDKESATNIVLSAAIGPYPAGTTVHQLLSEWLKIHVLTASAVIKATRSGSFSSAARLKRNQTGSFTADANLV
jgi:hypothetical protein